MERKRKQKQKQNRKPIDRCLYLVSSSASREYVADCVEALAVPRGSILHFRYLIPYIDGRLRKSLASNSAQLPKSLRKLPVVVVYLFQEQKSGEWTPQGSYLPLRCGRLIRAFTEGQVAHFFFEVTDYVKTKYRGVSIRDLLRKNGVEFKLNTGKPSFAHIAQKLNMAAPQVRDSEVFQEFVHKVYRSSEWRTRSLGIAPLDVTYEIIFFRVVGLYQQQGKQLIQVDPVQTTIGENVFSEYVLQSGGSYHIKVMTHLASRLAGHLPGQGNVVLRLQFDPTVIKPIGPVSFRISSPYDLQYWPFVVNGVADQRTALTVGCEYPEPAAVQDFVRKELLCPEVSLPILLTASTQSTLP